ncbi:MAG: protein-methionine-sulfoxide reductase heme-binding subunit MsrQ [Paraglaciecola sp.]|uniref:protein-methionine-sulfoxide reductase heme-binding subunit MsrQ n=1 Tax=Paraglaciecola sp. TaxID=1920173 RepID=UPI00329A12EC
MKLSKRITSGHILWLKLALHGIALYLLVTTFYRAFNDLLGVDPVQELLHFTGISAFNLLLLSLCISPFSKFVRQGQFLTLRRPIGIYAFVYALCHFSTYLVFELQLEWSLLFSEILKRPYITVGICALFILTVLTATSTRSIQRRMGKAWQKTHNWVYFASLLIVIHYFWSVKSSLIQPMFYVLAVFVLLLVRRNKFVKPLKSALQKRTKTKQNKKKLA